MTTFVDGPAKGKTMNLRRAVVFLRVTRKRFALEMQPEPHTKADQFDALDQPEDTPADGEELFCYLNTGKRNGACHMRFGGKDKHRSGFYVMAEYALYPDQPPDAIMRDNARWREWCGHEAFTKKIEHA